VQHAYRSAIIDYPGGEPPLQPTVSIVVPVYNEIRHINSIANALLMQDYPGLSEIWFVDGQSSDGTYEELQRIQKRDSRIRILSNPRRIQAAGINLALQQIQSDVVIRLDAHAQYAPDIILKSVQALLKTGAGGVGAIARTLAADSLMSQSIAAAHESKLGVGVAKFRQDSAGGWADTVWNGCYWKYIADRVGPFREDLARTEDNDFNARVRALGYGLYLSPDIEAYYYPRQSLRELWNQYFANGVGVIQTLFENRRAIQWRHLVPFTFVVSLLILVMISIIWSPARIALLFLILLYLLALLLFSVLALKKEPGWHNLLLPVVFIVLHFSYGLGALKGFLQRIFGI
jgi:succinoglycan biosynthesis protein ExoA